MGNAFDMLLEAYKRPDTKPFLFSVGQRVRVRATESREAHARLITAGRRIDHGG